ncbi:hypothetical protein ETB97_011526 [Aspergillus alliaceus]|uniref:Uncharacterized protein n=1 Tax=Petromyces alliaceus TaxID=209559 RepID=A0A8H6E7N7_PETAA|nr:hypothetical protein ETB97_011526 [Aspergillus burnettii]
MRGGAGANGKAVLDGTVTASGRQPPVLTVDSQIHVGMWEKLKEIMTHGIETVKSSLATMDRLLLSASSDLGWNWRGSHLRVRTFPPTSLTR